jgi:3-phosphoshikimate 1-carboxyvinyltransferase
MIREIMQRGPLHGRFRAPGSKSITNRALVCASLAHGRSVLENASDSDDTGLFANGLNQMGVLVQKSGSDLIVEGHGGRLYAPKFPIPVGNAGTTLRFLLSLSALAQGTVVCEGSERMGERPIEDLLEPLRALGIDAVRTPGRSRYEITGATLKGGEVTVRGDKSSQFLSSLMMVLPYAQGDVRLLVEGELISVSYVKMTLEVMRNFGVSPDVEDSFCRFLFSAGDRYSPRRFRVESDASGASYGLAAPAIAGGDTLVEDLTLESIQGDAGFAEILRRMGCSVDQEADGVRIRREGELRGIDVDMNTMPDVVPTLAVTALFASGRTSIRNVAHLRYKESDRLSALGEELRKLGARVVIYDDGLEVHPGALQGALLDTHDDHRLAMAFALAGLRVPGVRIENPDCVRKSFPQFWNEFERL